MKNWMTSFFLLSALALNVSIHNSSEPRLDSADFATKAPPAESEASDKAEENSEKKEEIETIKDQLPTADGLVPVTYHKISENKTMAVVPQMTESGVCDECDTKQYTLSISLEKNKDNLDALKVALLKSMAVTKEKSYRNDREDRDNAKLKKKSKSLNKESTYFADLSDECAIAESPFRCVVDGLIEAIQDGKASEAQITKFYSMYVGKKLGMEIVNTQSAEASRLAYQYYQEIQEALDNQSGFKILRVQLAKTAKESIGHYADEVQQSYNRFSELNVTNPVAAQPFMQQYIQGLQALPQLKQNLYDFQKERLLLAYHNNFITSFDFNNILNTNFMNPAQQIISTVSSPSQTFQYQTLNFNGTPLVNTTVNPYLTTLPANSVIPQLTPSLTQ